MSPMEPAETAAVDVVVSPDDAPTGTPPAARPASRRHHRWWLEWLIVIVVAAGCAFLVRTFVVQQFKVEGSSMRDTLHTGDRVLVNKLSYRLHDPRRGDVIVLEPKSEVRAEDLIKRVVALPGETVQMGADCRVLVNGLPIDQSYLSEPARTPGSCGQSFDAVKVPAGHVFVLGDNRGNSMDSRSEQVGAVPFERIVGRAFVVIWPRSDWRWL